MRSWRLPPAANSATLALHVWSSGLFHGRSDSLEFITRIPTGSITFLWQFLPGPENCSVFFLLAYYCMLVKRKQCIRDFATVSYINPRLTLTYDRSIYQFLWSSTEQNCLTCGWVCSAHLQCWGRPFPPEPMSQQARPALYPSACSALVSSLSHNPSHLTVTEYSEWKRHRLAFLQKAVEGKDIDTVIKHCSAQCDLKKYFCVIQIQLLTYLLTYSDRSGRNSIRNIHSKYLPRKNNAHYEKLWSVITGWSEWNKWHGKVKLRGNYTWQMAVRFNQRMKVIFCTVKLRQKCQ